MAIQSTHSTDPPGDSRWGRYRISTTKVRPARRRALPGAIASVVSGYPADSYFDTREKRSLHVEFFDAYPTRIPAGAALVAAGNETFETYRKEANITGDILADLADNAFRASALGQNYFDLAPGLADTIEYGKDTG